MVGHQPEGICSHDCPGTIWACTSCPAVCQVALPNQVGGSWFCMFVFLLLRGIRAGLSEVGVGCAGRQWGAKALLYFK